MFGRRGERISCQDSSDHRQREIADLEKVILIVITQHGEIAMVTVALEKSFQGCTRVIPGKPIFTRA